MPKLEFTPKELKGYFKEKLRHHFYEETIEKAEEMRIHADGKFPEKLIEERRPNEPKEVMDYRKKIFIPKTKPTFGRIVSSLSKIRRSSDWSIRYANLDKFTLITEDETLEQYCEFKFPKFTSVTNWVFSVLLKKYLTDPNAVVFTFPMEINVAENEHMKPYPVIFDSENVLDYEQDDYAILVNPLGSSVYSSGRDKGKSFYVVTTEKIQRYDQVNGKGDLALQIDYLHGIGFLPVFRIGAIVCKDEGNNYLHESRIADICPELNEALREYSDLQASKVLHIYPERWEITENECPKCSGTGRQPNPNWTEENAHHPSTLPCDYQDCHNGKVPTGPYSKILVRMRNALDGGGSVPIPPAGYVEKDVEIVRIQDEGVDKHIYSGLSAINFQFLEQTPLNQSGKAKEVDKDELNNTVNAIAEDLVRVMDNVYKIIAVVRYSGLYSIDEIVKEMLPKITVPEKFDILSSTHLEEQLTKAQENKVSPVILTALQKEYAAKKFSTDPSVLDRLTLILDLDPFPNVSQDEKMTMLSNKGITLENYIISSNIQEFVQMAIDEDASFADKPRIEQKDVLIKFAKVIIDEAEKKKQELTAAQQDTGIDELDKQQNNIAA